MKAKVEENKVELFQYRRERGICVECGRRKAKKGYVYCAKCKARRKNPAPVRARGKIVTSSGRDSHEF